MHETITYRLTIRQRALYLVIALVFAGLGTVTSVFYLGAIGMVIAACVIGFTGVTLTPEGITIQSITRTRIAWGSIRHIEVTQVGSSSTFAVAVHLADGQTKRLRSPFTSPVSPDDQFDAKFETIRQQWRHYTGQPPAVNVPDQPDA